MVMGSGCNSKYYTTTTALSHKVHRSLQYIAHCVQTDLAKNVWTRAYLIPDWKKVRILFIYLFFAWTWGGGINALLTISCCRMKHFDYVNWEMSDNVLQNDDQLDPEFRSVSLWMERNVLKERLMNKDDKNHHCF